MRYMNFGARKYASPIMAGITTIGQRTSIPTLYDHYFFTLARLRKHALTQPLAAELEALRPELDAAQAEELGLAAAQYEAEAAVQFVDDALDGIVDGVANTLLTELRGDRNAPLYLRYFGSQRPSEVKRPTLGGQLDTMRSWPPALAESTSPVLRDYGTSLAERLGEADAAAETKQRAAQQYKDFRVLGTRARLIDRMNAVRKSLYGKLGEIQHAEPSLGTGWAESFFRGSSSTRVTLTVLDRRIAAIETELAALRTQRDELAAQQERVAQAQAEAEEAEKRARLEAARAAAEELAAEIAELEGDIGSERAAG